VRKAAGFNFVGTDAICPGYVFHGELDEPAKLSAGFHPAER
jgi:hypothetical protein